MCETCFPSSINDEGSDRLFDVVRKSAFVIFIAPNIFSQISMNIQVHGRSLIYVWLR